MMTLDEAIGELLAKAPALSPTANNIETLPISDALSRVLAQDISSTIDVPPADNSAMDGYALNIDSLETQAATTTLAISQVISAGHPPEALEKGTAARIFTGAEIPLGANAVVMQEHCQADDSANPSQVTVPSDVVLNNNIRPQGQDISQNDKVLSQGRRLQAQDLGLLASIGISTVRVYRPLRVAILSTGDELVEPGQALAKGQIYNSNRYLLQGFLKKLGFEVIDCPPVKDTHEATVEAMREAANSDAIISTGGVSVGDEDHVKRAVMELGELDFWRIAIKPGKPVAFGSINTASGSATPFIGLPGNPASVFITFLLLAKPFLQAMQSQQLRRPKGVKVAAGFHWRANPKRMEFLRARIGDDGRLEIFPNQSSGVLSSTSWAEGLIIVRPQVDITTNDLVEFIHFGEFFNE